MCNQSLDADFFVTYPMKAISSNEDEKVKVETLGIPDYVEPALNLDIKEMEMLEGNEDNGVDARAGCSSKLSKVF